MTVVYHVKIMTEIIMDFSKKVIALIKTYIEYQLYVILNYIMIKKRIKHLFKQF